MIEWMFYALLASKAIFRARTYSHIIISDDDYLMNETRRKPTAMIRCPTLFDKGHGILAVAQTPLDIARPLFTRSWTTGGKSKCSGTRQPQLPINLSVPSPTRQPPDHPKLKDQNYTPSPPQGIHCWKVMSL